MGAALKFKQTELARQTGEVARLKILRGPDLGVTFVVRGSKVSIGRGEENDVVLTDMRASRKHCEIYFSNGTWNVQDAGSANGIAINGKPGRSAAIKTRDTIGLGETVIEFASAEAGTLMLVSPPSNLRQLEAEQANLDRQRARVQAMSQLGGLAKNQPKVDRLQGGLAPAAPQTAGAAGSGERDPKKMLLIAVVGVVAYFVFFADNGSKPAAHAKPKPAAVDDKSSLLGDAKGLPVDFGDGESVTKSAELFFKTGFREYRMGNYLRAKLQFENALQIDPDHRLSKIYLQNSENRIDEDVKKHLEFGRKNLNAGKLSEAKGDFETVMRLLYRDPQNPAYIEAHDQLDVVHKQQEREEN
jgi:pSer/pThr/pTyr-binding forkhead associated (FHA) protein